MTSPIRSAAPAEQGTRKAAHPGIGHGDRALVTGGGQLKGKQCDVLWADRTHANVRLDCGRAVLVGTVHLYGVPRRPKPDF